MAFEKVARVKVSAEVGRELERILRKFLDYHIERRMKTLEFMRKIS
jgi:RNase P/RNase MRP subunit p30